MRLRPPPLHTLIGTDPIVLDGLEGVKLMANTDLMSSEITSAIVMVCRGELVVVLILRKGKCGGGILSLASV